MPDRDPPSVHVVRVDFKAKELEVEIDGDGYLVSQEAPIRGVHRSCSVLKLTGDREGRTYRAVQYVTGRESCNCGDAVYRRRACKHILALREVGLLDEASEPPVHVPLAEETHDAR